MKRISLVLLVLGFLINGCGTKQSAESGEETSGMEEGQESEAVTVSKSQAWATDTIMKTSESVLYDQNRSVIYVSNINGFHPDQKDGDGFISKLNPEGEVVSEKWVTGINDPKGMGLHDNTLYVTDIDEIVAINVENGEITDKYAVDGAKFLNDITVSQDGKVFITDSDNFEIYTLEDGSVSLWKEGQDLEKPNGLLKEENRLLMASMESGKLRTVDLESKEYEEWVSGISSMDGIAGDGKGNYFVSNWNGEVYFVSSSGEKQKIVDTKDEEIHAADIDYAKDQNLLLVPTFFDNRVVAYKISYN